MKSVHISKENLKTTLGVYLAYVKKMPMFIARHAFICLLVVVLLELAVGGVLFYKYVLLAKVLDRQATDTTIMFAKVPYDQVLKAWESRKAIFEGALDVQYQNPF